MHWYALQGSRAVAAGCFTHSRSPPTLLPRGADQTQLERNFPQGFACSGSPPQMVGSGWPEPKDDTQTCTQPTHSKLTSVTCNPCITCPAPAQGCLGL